MSGFDYGPKGADGQYQRHPTLPAGSALPAGSVLPFIRPVRDRYVHVKCGAETRMGVSIAETYARKPGFYGSTFCSRCGDYFPVGASGEFVWDDGSKVGT